MGRQSLASQITHMCKEQTRFGTSKKSVRNQKPGEEHKYFFSVKSREKALGFFHRMAREIKKNHPEIRFVRDIKPEFVQEYLDRHQNEWKASTAVQYRGLVSKFEYVARAYYPSFKQSYKEVKMDVEKIDITPELVQNRTFTNEEIDRIVHEIDPNNPARYVPEICRRIGSRIEESCSIRPEDVRENGVFLNNTKGGKLRTVEYASPADRDWFYTLAETARSNGWPTLTGGISVSTAQQTFARAKKSAGLGDKYRHVGIHGIRRNYAQRHYLNERLSGRDHKAAWAIVQERLGHSSRYRRDLFVRYVGK